MSELVLRTEQDVEDLTWGATFYGVGGGGTASEGLTLLKKELARVGSITCVDPGALRDDAWTATVSFMGNRAPLSPEQESQKKNLGLWSGNTKTTWSRPCVFWKRSAVARSKP